MSPGRENITLADRILLDEVEPFYPRLLQWSKSIAPSKSDRHQGRHILLVYITLVNECDMGKSSISSQGNCGFETITPETAGRGCYGFKTTVTE